MASIATKKALLEKANAAYTGGRYAQAAELYRQLLRYEPKNPGVHLNLGKSLALTGDPRGAKKHLLEVLKVRPSDAVALAQLATVYRQDGRMDDAFRTIDKALRAEPGNAFALWNKADLLRLEGRFEEACELLRPHAEKPGADGTLTLMFAMLVRRFDGVDRAIEVLRALVDRPDLPGGVKMQAMFQLGQMLDRARRYDEAFEVFERANALKGARWDPDRLERLVDEQIATITPELYARIPSSTLDTQLPVFVLGMIRSGTTLTEQVVSSHPKVVAGGELRHMLEPVQSLLGEGARDMKGAYEAGRLTSQSLTRAGRAYLQKLKKLGPNAERVTDKMPYNFQFLGVIRKMFPGARIIHCTRAPLDNCLSCYFHDFTGSHDYTYDLEHLGRYTVQYKRLMDHWTRTLGIEVFEMNYERFVREQEPVTRELIEFLGLDWDDACLRFHSSGRASTTWSSEQVREPLYTRSSGRHANYEKHLGPLRRALGELASDPERA